MYQIITPLVRRLTATIWSAIRKVLVKISQHNSHKNRARQIPNRLIYHLGYSAAVEDHTLSFNAIWKRLAMIADV